MTYENTSNMRYVCSVLKISTVLFGRQTTQISDDLQRHILREQIYVGSVKPIPVSIE
jgi:hypothetical protein